MCVWVVVVLFGWVLCISVLFWLIVVDMEVVVWEKVEVICECVCVVWFVNG